MPAIASLLPTAVPPVQPLAPVAAGEPTFDFATVFGGVGKPAAADGKTLPDAPLKAGKHPTPTVLPRQPETRGDDAAPFAAEGDALPDGDATTDPLADAAAPDTAPLVFTPILGMTWIVPMSSPPMARSQDRVPDTGAATAQPLLDEGGASPIAFPSIKAEAPPITSQPATGPWPSPGTRETARPNAPAPATTTPAAALASLPPSATPAKAGAQPRAASLAERPAMTIAPTPTRRRPSVDPADVPPAAGAQRHDRPVAEMAPQSPASANQIASSTNLPLTGAVGSTIAPSVATNPAPRPVDTPPLKFASAAVALAQPVAAPAPLRVTLDRAQTPTATASTPSASVERNERPQPTNAVTPLATQPLAPAGTASRLVDEGSNGLVTTSTGPAPTVFADAPATPVALPSFAAPAAISIAQAPVATPTQSAVPGAVARPAPVVVAHQAAATSPAGATASAMTRPVIEPTPPTTAGAPVPGSSPAPLAAAPVAPSLAAPPQPTAVVVDRPGPIPFAPGQPVALPPPAPDTAALLVTRPASTSRTGVSAPAIGLPADRIDTPVAAAPLAAPVTHIARDLAQQPPVDTTRQTWPTQMVDRIERLRDAADAVSTSIRLIPDALGAIGVSVRKEGEVTHVHFAAEQPQTRALLAEAQPKLAELAEQRGLRLGHTEIGSGSASNGGQHQPAPQQQATRQPTAPARPARAETATADDSRIA